MARRAAPARRRCSTHRRTSFTSLGASCQFRGQLASWTALPLVTISSAYGALGGEVGRAVAGELDVPFLDRAIPAAVAEQLAVPLAEAETRDEALAGFLERLLGTFVLMGGMYGGACCPANEVPDEAAFLAATEQIIRRHAAAATAVILGRAGMIVLADRPHVAARSPERAARRADRAGRRRLYGLSPSTQSSRRARTTAPRAAWVQRFYGRDMTDPSLYDLVINATRSPSRSAPSWSVIAARAV